MPEGIAPGIPRTGRPHKVEPVVPVHLPPGAPIPFPVPERDDDDDKKAA